MKMFNISVVGHKLLIEKIGEEEICNIIIQIKQIDGMPKNILTEGTYKFKLWEINKSYYLRNVLNDSKNCRDIIIEWEDEMGEKYTQVEQIHFDR